MGDLFSFGTGPSGGGSGVWSGQSPYLKSLYESLWGLANQQSGGLTPGAPAGTAQPYAAGWGVPGSQQAGGYIPPGARAAYGSRAGKGYVQNGRYVAFGSPNAAQAPVQQSQAGPMPAQPQAQAMPAGPYAQPQTGQFGGSPIGQASSQLSQSLLSGNNPWVQGQVSNLGQNLGNFWNQQLLPGINQQASFLGGTGGARQGIAQGLGTQGLLQQFQQGANNIYANSLQNAGDLYNLGMAPWNAQWQPLQQFAGLLGGANILGQGSSGGFNIGIGGGGAGGGVPVPGTPS